LRVFLATPFYLTKRKEGFSRNHYNRDHVP
jgi:hypothetical protein